MSLCPSCNTEAGDIARYCPSCGTAIVRGPTGDNHTGRIFAGKFRMDALIGEGGMGRVYRATHLSLDKTVVLKVLRSSLLSDARTVARFQREARAASRLNHPNSIGVIDFGQSEDGAMYLAMEYVNGQDLHQILSKEGRLGEHRIVRIASQVLSALSDAHAAGVIHRDLKPENIMIEQRRGEPDFVKVLDFGIAKIQDISADQGEALTRAGFVCGTPEYMSPEQARGGTLDARSDLYAVGVICYQCATGHLPFESESAVGLATMHLTNVPIPPRQRAPKAGISEAMERLILAAMAKDPNDRPQSAEDFRRALLSLDQSEATRIQPPRPAGKRAGRPAPQDAVTALNETPAWATSPGEAGTGSTAAYVPPLRRKTAVVFVTALVLTAGVAAGGLFAYERYLRPRPAPSIVRVTPSANAPKTGDIDLVREAAEPSDPAKAAQERGARALELRRKADAELAAGRHEEALALYGQAWQSDPQPATIKRVALGHLLKGDAAGAQKWLRQYLADSKQKPEDAELIEQYVK